MAHMVEKMGFVGKLPWHGLGEAIPEEYQYDYEYFRNMSGLNWKVELRNMYYKDVNGVEHAIPNSSGRAMIRTDNMNVLGILGPRTHALQNEKAFEWFRPFLEEKLASLHTAGSLDEGRKIWVLAKLSGKPIEVSKHDVIDKYLLLSNSHDGKMSVRVGFTPIRVVCMNTLSAAHGDKASKLIRLRHSKDLIENLENVREVVDAVEEEFRATEQQYRKLQKKNINQDDLEKYIKVVLGVDEEEEISPQMQSTIDRINQLTVTGRGTNIPGVQGTMWGAYNAVTEWLSHEKSRTVETRMDNLWFGQGININQRALSTALELAMAG